MCGVSAKGGLWTLYWTMDWRSYMFCSVAMHAYGHTSGYGMSRTCHYIIDMSGYGITFCPIVFISNNILLYIIVYKWKIRIAATILSL